jgi:cell wall-associated NlpC family hydrolase
LIAFNIKFAQRAVLVFGLSASLGFLQPAFALNTEVPAQADDMQALLVSKGILSKIGGQIVQTGETVVHQVSERTSDLISTAVGLLGIPYLRGGNSTESGFDCSGFVRHIYKETLGLVLSLIHI